MTKDRSKLSLAVLYGSLEYANLGLVWITIFDKPRSSKQRYRLTAKRMRRKGEGGTGL